MLNWFYLWHRPGGAVDRATPMQISSPIW
ncbi:hypothetical protein [Hoeflea sp.]